MHCTSALARLTHCCGCCVRIASGSSASVTWSFAVVSSPAGLTRQVLDCRVSALETLGFAHLTDCCHVLNIFFARLVHQEHADGNADVEAVGAAGKKDKRSGTSVRIVHDACWFPCTPHGCLAHVGPSGSFRPRARCKFDPCVLVDFYGSPTFRSFAGAHQFPKACVHVGSSKLGRQIG